MDPDDRRNPFAAIYLTVTGSLTALLNFLGMVPFLAYRTELLKDNATGLPVFSLLLIDICIVILQIFPTVIAATGKWLFSDFGCTLYAAVDFYLSSSQIAVVTLIALDRYIVTCAPTWDSWRSVANYQKTFFFFGTLGALWCSLPAVGWASYAPSSSLICCSLNWTRTDDNYISFLTGTFLLLYLMPFCCAASLYYSTYEFVKRANSAEARDEATEPILVNCQWSPQNHIGKISLGCLLMTNMAHLGYGLLCLNPFNQDRSSVAFNLFPMLMSKFAGLFNPLFYVRFNPELWRYTKAAMCCRDAPPYVAVAPVIDIRPRLHQKQEPETPGIIKNYATESILGAYNTMNLIKKVPTVRIQSPPGPVTVLLDGADSPLVQGNGDPYPDDRYYANHQANGPGNGHFPTSMANGPTSNAFYPNNPGNGYYPNKPSSARNSTYYPHQAKNIYPPSGFGDGERRTRRQLPQTPSSRPLIMRNPLVQVL